jgi:hypothetical protein
MDAPTHLIATAQADFARSAARFLDWLAPAFEMCGDHLTATSTVPEMRIEARLLGPP